MQFDFNLGPGASQTIDVKGRFFKYKSGTGLIRVRTSLGGYVDVLPGQGIENVNFTSLTISDRTGASNVGSILAGDFDFRDDRISGTVDVVDGGKARTVAGIAFMGANNCQALAGEYAHAQLWNPPSSTKNIILESVLLASSVAGQVYFGPSNVELTTVATPPVSKKFAAGAAATSAQARTQSSAVYLINNSFGNVLVNANVGEIVTFKEPVVIAPGNGFLMVAQIAGAKVVTLAEYFEDSL